MNLPTMMVGECGEVKREIGATALTRQSVAMYRLFRAAALVVGLFALLVLSNVAQAHGMSEAEKQAVIDGGNLRYLWLGATHMLSGYDHLAFVFGIIFFLTTFRDIAKYVTAFTVGHSITLIYATFNAIQLNYFLIDAVIGLSVSYIAFANLDGFRKMLRVNPPNMMLMIVGLGLIHGFGLSTRLQELPLSEDQLLLNIISFNVGIELGQGGALAAMLLVIAAWRQSQFFQTFSLAVNYTLIAFGGFLFLMQMHGYDHATNAELTGGTAVSVTAGAVTGGQSLPAPQAVASAEWKDTIDIIVPARGELEYKVRLTSGATFDYAWQTDGEPLYFDFHGDVENDPNGAFQSFGKGTQAQSSGSLTASFTGKHGWYWKNNSRSAAIVTLNVRGDYQRLDQVQSSHDSIE